MGKAASFTIAALAIAALAFAKSEVEHSLNKRVLPTNEQCDPAISGNCRKGDWVAENIADCEYDRSLLHPISCDAQNDRLGSWIVDVAKEDRCIPSSGGRFRCGASGTNTRCVCSDSNIHRTFSTGEYFNRCRCQYWPPLDIGFNHPAFCTGYYTGGKKIFRVHHWACCNNCNDQEPNTCDRITWQGGSTGSYCGQCGANTGGGREKYFFNCGNCDSQRTCADMCDDQHWYITKPGYCWKWLDCFKGCCIEMNTQPHRKKRQTIMTFCGDGNCTGSETPTSCPIDCCYQVNSTCSTTECTPSCCQTPHCCAAVGEVQEEQGNGAAAGTYFSVSTFMIGLMLTMVMF